MKGNVRLIQSRRVFTKEFKKTLVFEFERGVLSVQQIAKLHGISSQSIYNWIYKYSNFNEKGIRIVEMDKSSTERVKELENRLKELEQIVGRKQIKIDYLESLIDVANEEFNVDIKKNSSTQQSKNSEKIDKK